jgi:hypothetical protein
MKDETLALKPGERTDFERETRPEAGAHPRAVAEEGNTEAFQLSCRLV